jgi:hypothetical protein
MSGARQPAAKARQPLPDWRPFRSCAAGIGSTGANLIILKSARQRAGQIAKPFGKIELHCRAIEIGKL